MRRPYCGASVGRRMQIRRAPPPPAMLLDLLVRRRQVQRGAGDLAHPLRRGTRIPWGAHIAVFAERRREVERARWLRAQRPLFPERRDVAAMPA